MPHAASAKSLLYLELADSIQRLINDGTLRVGQRIPSVRRLARQKGVSVASVVQAYLTLENRGCVEARHRSGFFVRARPPLSELKLASIPLKPAKVVIHDLTDQAISTAVDSDYVPLGAAVYPPDLFPTRRLSRFIASAARKNPTLIGRWDLDNGHETFRREIARRYLRAGMTISHDRFIVTAGCVEALTLALRAVSQPGDAIAVETPVWFRLLRILKGLDLKVVEIPADPESGIDLESLRQAVRKHSISALMVIPSFHNPVGFCMPDERKAALAQMIADMKLPTIENDICGEFLADNRRPIPLKAWDREGWVLLCSSLSKTLAPGLRLGWLDPGRFRRQIEFVRQNIAFGTPLVLQQAAADFLREGSFDRHLRTLQRRYQEQLRDFTQGLHRHFPQGIRVSRPKGGVFLWVELPRAVDSIRLYWDALMLGVSIAPGPLFTSRQAYRNCIRLNCCIEFDERIDAAMHTVGRLVAKQVR